MPQVGVGRSIYRRVPTGLHPRGRDSAGTVSASLPLRTAMNESLPRDRLRLVIAEQFEEARLNIHAGLDLSRRRLDVSLVDGASELVAHTTAPPDTDGLRDTPACAPASSNPATPTARADLQERLALRGEP
jgi:hypothetical protein